jgi:hypothetical protein
MRNGYWAGGPKRVCLTAGDPADAQDKRLPPVAAVSIQTSKGQLKSLKLLLLALEHPRIAVIVHMDEKVRHSEHGRLADMINMFR